jgi:hypothetical protein
MATKPAKGRQPPKLSKNQQELRILKKAGLWSGDWRKAKQPTGAQKRLRAKFKDELPGLAAGTIKTVKVSGVKRADVAADLKLTKGRAVVRAPKGETLRYNPKTKTITSTVKAYGVTYRRIIQTPRAQSIAELPRGKNLRYQVPLGQLGMESPIFSSPEKLAEFMAPYESDRIRRNGRTIFGYKGWLDYIEILEITKPKKQKAREVLMDDKEDEE